MQSDLGREINGAKSWLYIGGFGLQVAEIAKVGTVLAATAFLSRKEVRATQFGWNWAFFRTLLVFVVIVAIPMVLVVAQNDTGTGLVFAALVPVMLFWSGLVPLPWMALLFGGPAVVSYLAIVNPWWAAIFVVGATVGMVVWTRTRWMGVLMFVGVGPCLCISTCCESNGLGGFYPRVTHQKTLTETMTDTQTRIYRYKLNLHHMVAFHEHAR